MRETDSLVLEELAHAGEASEITPELLKLDSCRITSESNLPTEEFMMRFFGRPCFPRKDLTSITGPAKGGKTFLSSMLMACGANTAEDNRRMLELERVAEQPLKVMWYDTEESKQTTKHILANRVFQMAKGQDLDRQFFVFNVRAFTWQERQEELQVAIRTYRPDIVIIDGIADLLPDINDGPKAIELIEHLLQLADEYNCNITTIIHLNRTGEKSNLRGWLGTVILQKSYEVFVCEKVFGTSTMSVELSTSRKTNLDERMYYQVNDKGIPYAAKRPDTQPRNERGQFVAKNTDKTEAFNPNYLIDSPQSEQGWEWNLTKLFSDAMAGRSVMGYDDLKNAVQQLSNIKQKQYYYKVFEDAESKGIVKKTYDRHHRIVIIMPPR